MNPNEYRKSRKDYWLSRLKGYSLLKEKHYNSLMAGFTLRRGRWFVQINPEEYSCSDRVSISYVSSSELITGPWCHTYHLLFKPVSENNKHISLIIDALVDNTLLPLCMGIHSRLTDIIETYLKEL